MKTVAHGMATIVVLRSAARVQAVDGRAPTMTDSGCTRLTLCGIAQISPRRREMRAHGSRSSPQLFPQLLRRILLRRITHRLRSTGRLRIISRPHPMKVLAQRMASIVATPGVARDGAVDVS